MAYDKQYAHEYYIKYRKKNLLKGRKKGKKRKSSSSKGSGKAKTVSLLGISTSGLNDKGRVEAELIKQNLKKQMNSALSKAKTDEERDQIQREYSNKAIDAINQLKSNSEYAKPSSSKSKSSSGSGSGSKSSGSSSSGKASTSTTTVSAEGLRREIESLNNMMADLNDKLAKMTENQKNQAKNILTDILTLLKNEYNVDVSGIEKRLKSLNGESNGQGEKNN